MAAVDTTLYGKEGENKFQINPKTTATQVTISDDKGSPSTVQAEVLKLREKINAIANEGILFRGVVTQTNPLPTVAYKAGWQYSVGEAGSYAGQNCEVGDFIICVKDYASGSASNKDWNVLQVNLDGVVTGPAKSVARHVVVFDDTTGKHLEDSGFTIAKSVPEDADFNNTTYLPATDSADGLMTAAEHKKLAGIAVGADKTTAKTVGDAGAFMKATDTADSIQDGATKVVMTKAERDKLGKVATGAEVNQNAFTNIKVGGTTVSADSKTDTLELAAGTGINLQADASLDKVTISEAYVDSCVVSDLEAVPANLRNGGLIIVKQ